jgi:hypothetical protein
MYKKRKINIKNILKKKKNFYRKYPLILLFGRIKEFINLFYIF